VVIRSSVYMPTFRRYDNTLTSIPSFPRSLFSFLSFRSFKMAASLRSLRINTIFERPLKRFDGNAARHVARQSKWKEQHEKNVRLAISCAKKFFFSFKNCFTDAACSFQKNS
jgi:hypothetical protein